MAIRRKREDGSIQVLDDETADSPLTDPTHGTENTETDAAADDGGDYHGELAHDPGADLATALPESLTINVDLPATVHSVPEHEVAVAIDENTVNPGEVVLSADPSTTTISVIADDVAIHPEEPVVEEKVIPELPERAFSRRDRLRGAVSDQPETAAMLTADRLMETKGKRRHAPEGGWPSFVYAITLHMVNLGDSQKVRDRKAVDARIDRQFEGSARFVPVLTRKGGVGKTTITTIMGMAFADVREDRIVAIDANPDRGTLAERINKQTRATVRDVVTRAPSINGFTDFSTLVSRDETRLDVLASDTDPLLSEAFDENDYNVVADLTERYYSLVLTDCGTGIVHSVMRATLQRADSIVIVSGGSVDEARLASETLTWLEANGYGDLVRNAVVALNTATQGTNLIKLEEIEAHFRSRVREIVRIPYDPQLAAGSVVNYRELRPITRDAARELAALVADGLPVRRVV
ncbi:MinD-like ATPase involved in chromosome partitioning or flagellar assembly [Conyzicola lurida]|uniref:MinD-like ATPase involved in chromosome partitioning or flagellar assembly n=1 Tax=Conyzicola lurida TaxID=1172621 RepID=A0A841AKQ5_9MICO|nr:MinD-like ATPase involved in chromosome partitioning or flagellar assembly [Conyzicola lurida]